MGSNSIQNPYCEFPQDLRIYEYHQSNEPTFEWSRSSEFHLAKFMAIRIASLEQYTHIRSPHSNAILQQLIPKFEENANIQSPQRIIIRDVHSLIALANQFYIGLNSSFVFCLFCHSSQSIIDVINGASVHQCLLPRLIQYSNLSKGMR